MSAVVEASGRRIEVSNPDKELFPDAGYTKLDLARYYQRVAPVMVPHIRDRPLTMHRWPDGLAGTGFYQQEAPGYFPAWVRTVPVPHEDGTVEHVVADDAATLVYLADQACITPHVWLSRADRLDVPDRVVFDLDPPTDEPWVGPVRAAARAVHDLLADLHLDARLMTTGSRGYHIVVPLERSDPFDDVRRFAREVATLLARRHPDSLTVEQRKERRGNRVFIDYLRNTYAHTTVAPYAVRALRGAPVATPVDWDELGAAPPQRYDIGNVLRRLGQKDDPWRDLSDESFSLVEARTRLDKVRRAEG